MPYVDQEKREEFKPILINLYKQFINNGAAPGDLNYLITKIIHAYLGFKGKNYANLNEIMGVLESAKSEFYRRVVAPYEDEKIKLNGDVS